MPSPPGADVVLQIDQLVLDGLALPRGHERRLRAALADELAQLIAAGGLSAELLAGGALRTLPAGALAADHGGDPAALGRGIARALYDRLGPAPTAAPTIR
jgi:hypothetical protein